VPHAKTKTSQALTLAATSLGFVVVQLDVTVVNVALTSIGTSFGGGIAALQWAVNAYTLAFAALILSAGALGDRLGAKRVFIAGFVVFALASLGCGLAPNLGVFILMRALQGLGAAILVPSSLSLLNHAYPGDAERVKAVGLWAAGASAALAAGPVVGGVLIAAAGWRLIFLINLPLGLLAIWLTARHAAETSRSRAQGFDLGGQLLGILALASLAASMIGGGGERGWSSPFVLGGMILAELATIAFVAVEARSASPMLPLSLFRAPTFSATTIVGLLMNVCFYGLIFVLSLYFQTLRGYSALRTGFAFLPMTAVVLAANLLAPRAANRFGPRVPIIAGLLLMLAGCGGLATVGAASTYAAIAAQLLALGCGVGLIVPPMTSAMLGAADRKRSGIASGVLNTARQTGSVIGVALFGSLLGGRAHFISGLHLAVTLCIGALLASGVAAWFIPAPSPQPPTVHAAPRYRTAH
jgi:DHA2 family methylenomycin A resistance protein-like MFS transporter